MKDSLPPSLLHHTFTDTQSLAGTMQDRDGTNKASFSGGGDLGFLGGGWVRHSCG